MSTADFLAGSGNGKRFPSGALSSDHGDHTEAAMIESEEPTMAQQPQPYHTANTQQGISFIGPQSWVPIGFVAAICIALLTVKSWLDSQFDGMRDSLQVLQVDVRELRAAEANRWTTGDMALWVERLARANPGIAVPESGRRDSPR